VPEFHFDERAATIAVNFFERLLRHSKGEWAGQPFTLQAWQRDQIIRPLFGWKRADGTRQYRMAYIEIPRKNGKSSLISGIANYLLFADDEPSAEIYSCAADRDQAAIVFDEAKRMIEGAPVLMRSAEIFKRSIYVPKTKSSYRVLSADAFTKHGLNASGILFDELHAQPNRDLWDVMKTSTGARRKPLMVMITTAGYDRESICWEQHEYAQKVLSGVIDDPEFFRLHRRGGRGGRLARRTGMAQSQSRFGRDGEAGLSAHRGQARRTDTRLSEYFPALASESVDAARDALAGHRSLEHVQHADRSRARQEVEMLRRPRSGVIERHCGAGAGLRRERPRGILLGLAALLHPAGQHDRAGAQGSRALRCVGA
jgi:hypothetical protein